MTEDGEGEPDQFLAEQRVDGLKIKLERGFNDGAYGAYVESDPLAAKVGFAAAHRRAVKYCSLLKDQHRRFPSIDVGETEDASLHGGPCRKRDLEATFLSFGSAERKLR